MARPISDEELQLKKRARRRLVGAIVLVTAVAVVLPMVLDSEPKPVNQNLDIQIPSPDSGDFKPKASAPIRIAPDTSLAKVPDAPAKGDAALPPVIADSTPAPSAAKAEPAATKPGPAEKPIKEDAKSTPKAYVAASYSGQSTEM